MNTSKSRRPSAVQALSWFVPGFLAVVVAGLVTHPLTLIPLLVANALCMAASCHALGFDLEPRFGRTVMRRGATYLVLFTAYTAAVFALVAWPLLELQHLPSALTGVALGVTLALAVAILWRVWPAFGLVFFWDDAYPARADGSWIFTAAARSLAFGRHLSREERSRFTHFLPVALALLVLAFGTIALAGLYGVVPAEIRTAALGLYGLVVMPLACLVIANRTVCALLTARGGRRNPDGTPAAVPDESAPHPDDAEPAPEPASAPQPVPAVPEGAGEDQALTGSELLAATRAGHIERALELLAAGASPATVPGPDDRDQRPVLMLAALLPDLRLLRALIAAGADVDHASGGLTPLLAATRDSWHGRAEAVLTLLANGADPLRADAGGNTALHGAVLSAEPGVAAMLLDAGAAVDALNAAGESPLSVACRGANWPMLRFLLDRGAKTAPAGGVPALVAAAGIGEDDPAGVALLLAHKAAPDAVDGQQATALLVAAAEGHEKIVAALCAAGADAAHADARGNTPLMEAAQAGADGIVRQLAEAGADVAARDGHGRDALMLACQSPQAQGGTIQALLALGADAQLAGPDGQRAVDYAAAAGRWDLVALLDPETPLPASLGSGLLVVGQDTPAHLLDALRFGHWAIVSTFAERVREWPMEELVSLYLDVAAAELGAARRWLLEHGLDPEARLAAPVADAEAETAAEPGADAAAAAAQDADARALGPRLFDVLLERLPATADAVDDLLRAGASAAGTGTLALALARIGSDTSAGALPLRLLAGGADPFGTDAHGRTPLQLAAMYARLDLATALLAMGCNPNVRDDAGRTPLFAAIAHGTAALALVRALVAHGADPEAADAKGETPLGAALDNPALEHWLDWRDWTRPARPLRADDLTTAAGSGALPSVRRLLELGFPVDTQDAQGATALLRASGNGHAQVATCLLDAGADPTLAAHSGVTALTAAVGARQLDVVRLLLQQGSAQVDQRLPNAATALMVAAALGYPEIVEALHAAGADANAVDDAGRNALHAAAQFSFGHNDSLRARRLFDVLLKHAADVNQADRSGLTPLLLLLGAHMHPGSACDATHLGALVPLLLDAGAQPRHADERGVTPLHVCAMHALVAPARILLARGADRDAVDAFGRTPADVARQLGYVDVAHELASRGSFIPSVRQTLRSPAEPAD